MNKLMILGGLGVAAGLAALSKSGGSDYTFETDNPNRASDDEFENPGATVDPVTGAIEVADWLLDQLGGPGTHSAETEDADGNIVSDDRDVLVVEDDGTVTAPAWSAPVSAELLANAYSVFVAERRGSSIPLPYPEAGDPPRQLVAGLDAKFFNREGWIFLGPTTNQIVAMGLRPMNELCRDMMGGLMASLYGIRDEESYQAAYAKYHPAVYFTCPAREGTQEWNMMAAKLARENGSLEAAFERFNAGRRQRGAREYASIHDMIADYLSKG
jgi:hypothetical protein